MVTAAAATAAAPSATAKATITAAAAARAAPSDSKTRRRRSRSRQQRQQQMRRWRHDKPRRRASEDNRTKAQQLNGTRPNGAWRANRRQRWAPTPTEAAAAPNTDEVGARGGDARTRSGRKKQECRKVDGGNTTARARAGCNRQRATRGTLDGVRRVGAGGSSACARGRF